MASLNTYIRSLRKVSTVTDLIEREEFQNGSRSKQRSCLKMLESVNERMNHLTGKEIC